MKVRKKPVIVDAVQWLGDNFIEIDEFITCDHETYPSYGVVMIRTLEGIMRASKGDWIIRGVNGEYYPCKDEIFWKTYETVSCVKQDFENCKHLKDIDYYDSDGIENNKCLCNLTDDECPFLFEDQDNYCDKFAL